MPCSIRRPGADLEQDSRRQFLNKMLTVAASPDAAARDRFADHIAHKRE
jgi:hypothetical protein